MNLNGSTIRVASIANSESRGFDALGLVGDVLRCERGCGLTVCFNSGQFIKTSEVTSIRHDKKANTVKVTTKNNEYILEILEGK